VVPFFHAIALVLAGQAQEATPSAHRGLKLQPDSEFEFFPRLASPAFVVCYWQRPLNGHSGPQVAFIALGCHSVGRVSDGLASRLHELASAPEAEP
jgi:hypothetical protein